MRGTIAQLLATCFDTVANTADIAANIGGMACPCLFAGGMALTGVLQFIANRADAQLSEENADKLDQLLRNDWRQQAAMRELAVQMGIPLGSSHPDETPERLLFESLRQSLRDHCPSKQQIDEALARLEGQLSSLAALLLDDATGLSAILRRQGHEANAQLQRLARQFAELRHGVVEDLIGRLHYPRLSLPLTAYSLDGSAVRRLYYGSRRVTLVGRDHELARLEAFLTPRPEHNVLDLSWWLWTGPGGVGKSRLALELCLVALRRGWQAGFWDRNDPFTDWDRWRVEEPTLVVVDYVAVGDRHQRLRNGLTHLVKHPEQIGAPLRMLLLERSADEDRDTWWREFSSAASWSESHPVRDCRHAEPVELAPLGSNPDAIWTIFEEVFAERCEIQPSFQPPNRQVVLDLYSKVDEAGRPLFAAAAAEAIALGESADKIRDWTPDDLVQEIVQREVDAWREAGIDESHGNAVLYATLVGGLPLRVLDEMHAAGLPVPGPNEVHDDWLHRMTSFSISSRPDELRPLEPDLLGEWFALERMAGRMRTRAPNARVVQDAARSCLEHAWNKWPWLLGVFLVRCANDYPAHPQVLAAMSAVGELGNVAFYAAVLGDSVRALFAAGREESVRYGIERIESYLNATPGDTHTIRMLAILRNNRGVTYGEQGRVAETLADYTAVVEMPDAPAAERALALFNRGVTYGEQGHVAEALADYMAVVEMPDAPAEQRAKALFNRGVTYGQQGRVAEALADYTAVVEMPDAPAEQRAQALVNRGITHGRQGRVAEKLADYTAVVEMPDATADQRARALVNRGITHGQQGRVAEVLADYTAVVKMPDAPAEQRAQALMLLAGLGSELPKTARCAWLAEAAQHFEKLGNADLLAHINRMQAELGC